jgi:Immunoglobulin I-set domain
LEVKWLRQGRPLPNCEDFRYMTLGKGVFALQLADPFVEDSGLYTCEAEGIFGKISTSARLSVAAGSENRSAAAPPSDVRRSPIINAAAAEAKEIVSGKVSDDVESRGNSPRVPDENVAEQVKVRQNASFLIF